MKDPLTPELLSSLCHDLRGPLGAMGTWVHVLSSGRARPETQAQALASMATDVQAMGSLIEQLSAFGSLLSRSEPIQLEDVDLGAMVESACASAPKSTDAEIQVQIDATAPVIVKADKALLTQFANLLAARSLTGRPGGRVVAVRLDGSQAVLTLETSGAAPRALGAALARALCETQGAQFEPELPAGRTGFVVRFPRA